MVVRLSAMIAAAVPLPGCLESVVLNQTKERVGDITVQFINNTTADAAFTYGSWDEWDRQPRTVEEDPTVVEMDQLVLPRQSVSEVYTLHCARNLAIGTEALVARVLAARADLTDSFVPEAFDSVVHFSRAVSGSDAANLPTSGTAEGIELLLGLDYSCEDRVIFTFVEDPDAPGGFRIDFEVIRDRRPDQ